MTVQTAAAATTEGFAIVVADPKFESEMEHAIAADAEFRAAVKIWAPAKVLIAVPASGTEDFTITITDSINGDYATAKLTLGTP